MSFDTYSNLQTEIGSWLKRPNLASATIQGFISLAEKEMNKRLRTRNQEVRETFSLGSRYTDLTTLTNDILEMRNVQINTDPVRVLEYRTPHQIDLELPSETTGKPVYYTLHGDELEVKPVPDTTYTAEASFYAPVTALSGSVASNWVLENHPNLYLFGSLYYGCLFIQDSTAEAYKALFEQEINEINSKEKKARYSGSPLIVRTSTGNP